MKIENKIITIPVNINIEVARIGLKVAYPKFYYSADEMTDQEVIENVIYNCIGGSYGFSLPEGAFENVD